jgi:hypothetical protein
MNHEGTKTLSYFVLLGDLVVKVKQLNHSFEPQRREGAKLFCVPS